MTPLVLWLPVTLLGVFVLWSLIDGLALDPPRARRRFNAIAAALGLTPADDGDDRRHVHLDIGDRAVMMRAVHVGGQESNVRGAQGRLWVLETPLRVSRWEMHDVAVRQRRRAGEFGRRFAIRESGVPVRDGWLGDPVRRTVTTFFDCPLARGTLQVDRGLLKHVVSWSAVPDQPSAVELRTLAARFVAVAEAFDDAASRRHPMA